MDMYDANITDEEGGGLWTGAPLVIMERPERKLFSTGWMTGENIKGLNRWGKMV